MGQAAWPANSRQARRPAPRYGTVSKLHHFREVIFSALRRFAIFRAMNQLLPSANLRTKSNRAENAAAQRRGEQYSALPFHRPPALRSAAPADDAWSVNTVWYTVLFVGCLAAALLG